MYVMAQLHDLVKNPWPFGSTRNLDSSSDRKVVGPWPHDIVALLKGPLDPDEEPAQGEPAHPDQ